MREITGIEVTATPMPRTNISGVRCWTVPAILPSGSHGAARMAARNGSPVPTITSQATLRRSSRPNKCRVSMPEMNISSSRPS